jgi:hypothetical protein
MKNEGKLVSAFDEIIEGKSVNRSVHDLDYEGVDLTHLFIARLKSHRFVEKGIGEIELQFEERVPAFAIRKGKAKGCSSWNKSYSALKFFFNTSIICS